MKNNFIIYSIVLMVTIVFTAGYITAEPEDSATKINFFMEDISRVSLFKKVKAFELLGIDFNDPTQYIFQVNDDHMEYQEIYKNDYIIVDRSLSGKNNDIIIAEYNGYLVLRKLIKSGSKYHLASHNGKLLYNSFKVWGIVTHSFNFNNLRTSKTIGLKRGF